MRMCWSAGRRYLDQIGFVWRLGRELKGRMFVMILLQTFGGSSDIEPTVPYQLADDRLVEGTYDLVSNKVNLDREFRAVASSS